MKFSNVRLLVKDFAKCFKFYSEQLRPRGSGQCAPRRKNQTARC